MKVLISSAKSLNAPTLAAFKRSLKSEVTNIPNLFYYSERRDQIMYTRLRPNCSSVASDLFDKNIAASPLCDCGVVENSYHFFFICQKYVHLRPNLINTLSKFCTPTVHAILYGDPVLLADSNTATVTAVHKFIRDTKRF
jgi:hypothetical protein